MPPALLIHACCSSVELAANKSNARSASLYFRLPLSFLIQSQAGHIINNVLSVIFHSSGWGWTQLTSQSCSAMLWAPPFPASPLLPHHYRLFVSSFTPRRMGRKMLQGGWTGFDFVVPKETYLQDILYICHCLLSSRSLSVSAASLYTHLLPRVLHLVWSLEAMFL